jgi:hypothetical protein
MGRLSSENLKEQEGMAYSMSMVGLSFRVVNLLYNCGMRSEEQLYLGTVERARKQSALLLRLYEAELAADPTSYATESSRSNLMALRHTIAQLYGDI